MRTLISLLLQHFCERGRIVELQPASRPRDELDALDEMSNREGCSKPNCWTYPLIRRCSPGFKRREFGPQGEMSHAPCSQLLHQ